MDFCCFYTKLMTFFHFHIFIKTFPHSVCDLFIFLFVFVLLSLWGHFVVTMQAKLDVYTHTVESVCIHRHNLTHQAKTV